jgi:hypothetical protein
MTIDPRLARQIAEFRQAYGRPLDAEELGLLLHSEAGGWVLHCRLNYRVRAEKDERHAVKQAREAKRLDHRSGSNETTTS